VAYFLGHLVYTTTVNWA